MEKINSLADWPVCILMFALILIIVCLILYIRKIRQILKSAPEDTRRDLVKDFSRRGILIYKLNEIPNGRVQILKIENTATVEYVGNDSKEQYRIFISQNLTEGDVYDFKNLDFILTPGYKKWKKFIEGNEFKNELDRIGTKIHETIKNAFGDLSKSDQQIEYKEKFLAEFKKEEYPWGTPNISFSQKVTHAGYFTQITFSIKDSNGHTILF